MQIGLHLGQEICRACRSSAINSCTSKHKNFITCHSPPLPSLANMSSIDAQKQKLQTALQAFDAIIKALPKTLSVGDKTGPIAANFTSHKFNSDEGPYYSFDKAWNRIFQVPDTQKISLICRGSLAFNWCTHTLHTMLNC